MHAHAVTRRAVDERKLELIARIGHLTKGILYAVTGGVALEAALEGGRSVGTKGALVEIARQPFGLFLLGAMTAGLFAYALYMFASAALNLEGHGRDRAGTARRVGEAASALVHTSLGIWAASFLAGRASRGSGQHRWTAELMQHTWGVWLVGLVGLGVLFAAVSQFQRAWSHEFMRKLKREEMREVEVRAVRRTGEVGLVARGVVFVLTAWFLIKAALAHDPSEVGGLGKALAAIQEQTWGPWLLGIMAVALLAYAAYCGLLARYRRFGRA